MKLVAWPSTNALEYRRKNRRPKQHLKNAFEFCLGGVSIGVFLQELKVAWSPPPRLLVCAVPLVCAYCVFFVFVVCSFGAQNTVLAAPVSKVFFLRFLKLTVRGAVICCPGRSVQRGTPIITILKRLTHVPRWTRFIYYYVEESTRSRQSARLFMMR